MTQLLLFTHFQVSSRSLPMISSTTLAVPTIDATQTGRAMSKSTKEQCSCTAVGSKLPKKGMNNMNHVGKNKSDKDVVGETCMKDIDRGHMDSMSGNRRRDMKGTGKARNDTTSTIFCRGSQSGDGSSSSTLKRGGIFGRHCNRGKGIMISSTSNRRSGGQLRGGKSNGTAARLISTVKKQGEYHIINYFAYIFARRGYIHLNSRICIFLVFIFHFNIFLRIYDGISHLYVYSYALLSDIT